MQSAETVSRAQWAPKPRGKLYCIASLPGGTLHRLYSRQTPVPRKSTSRMNVTEIAFESGFEDISHFSRVFKDRFNVPPLSYRHVDPGAE